MLRMVHCEGSHVHEIHFDVWLKLWYIWERIPPPHHPPSKIPLVPGTHSQIPLEILVSLSLLWDVGVNFVQVCLLTFRSNAGNRPDDLRELSQKGGA